MIVSQRTSAVFVVSLAALGPSVSAWARDASGPIRDPKTSSKHHLAFHLKGAGWGQVRGASAGTPSLGNYTRSLPARHCDQRLEISGVVTGRRPTIKGHRLMLRPGSQVAANTLRIHRTGTNGKLRWWSGDRPGYDAGLAALRPFGGPGQFLVVEGRPFHPDSSDAITSACRRAILDSSGPVIRAAARSLVLADGPPVIAPPYATAG